MNGQITDKEPQIANEHMKKKMLGHSSTQGSKINFIRLEKKKKKAQVRNKERGHSYNVVPSTIWHSHFGEQSGNI